METLLPAATVTLMAESAEEAVGTQVPSPKSTSGSGNADVLFVRAEKLDNNTWAFTVTVRHPDTGWEDYADGWDVVTLQGEVIKPNPESQFTRTLLHPHVDEQPFTRSQSGIRIPEDVTEVMVRAHDLVSGFGGQQVNVNLMQSSGKNFEVIR